MESVYAINDEKLEQLRRLKPWMSNPKHFQSVKISPSAVIKMMLHGQQGVEKGIKKSGKPIEVMGLLLGRPDTDDNTSIIISDAQALPIEGFETKVVADDENVINYMIELGESLELSRKEIFCGWYHTHPFDLDINSNCFLSNTDITTQLQWQRSEDPHGNPWIAIVIDPLTSIARDKPELMAFRVYPPDFSPPVNETPDGSIVKDDKTRVAKWGACWNRYYRLETTYFMSRQSKSSLGVLRDKFLWQNSFVSSLDYNNNNDNDQDNNSTNDTNKRIKAIVRKIESSSDGKLSLLSMDDSSSCHPLFSFGTSPPLSKGSDESVEGKRIDVCRDCYEVGSSQIDILTNKHVTHSLFN